MLRPSPGGEKERDPCNSASFARLDPASRRSAQRRRWPASTASAEPMPRDLFVAVDRYIDDLFAPEDAALQLAVAEARAAGLPQIQVSAGQGKLLYLLARLVGARRILEIGTLGGYSAIWLARALPDDGFMVTLELEPAYARVAAKSLHRAGLLEKVD